MNFGKLFQSIEDDVYSFTTLSIILFFYRPKNFFAKRRTNFVNSIASFASSAFGPSPGYRVRTA